MPDFIGTKKCIGCEHFGDKDNNCKDCVECCPKENRLIFHLTDEEEHKLLVSDNKKAMKDAMLLFALARKGLVQEMIIKVSDYCRNFKLDDGTYPLYDYVGNIIKIMEEE